MKFCQKCDNLLVPKKKSLYCRACDCYYNLGLDIEHEYHLVKNIYHHETDLDPLIMEGSLKEDRISNEDRKAFKDYFELSSKI